jgi:peptidoglycan hydrolase-like protein with peptidoglycan-binding domain
MRAVVKTLAAAVATAVMVGLAPVANSAPAPAAARAECRRTLPAYPEIKPGTTSKAVRSLQCVLNDAGFGPVTVDGFYGPETQGAVKELTDAFECCIPKPLVVRTWYWTILFARSHKLFGLGLGDSGIRVKTLQRALRADGETLVVDGDFGPQTVTQVKVFQGKCDLRRTGRINQKTSFHLSMGGCNAEG